VSQDCLVYPYTPSGSLYNTQDILLHQHILQWKEHCTYTDRHCVNITYWHFNPLYTV